MANYYPPRYEGEDVGAGIVQQRPTSARRYITVDRPPTGTQRLQPSLTPASPTRPVRTTIDVVRNGDEMNYQSSFARPRRAPSTRDDPHVTTNLKPAPKRMSRRNLILSGFGLVAGTLIAGDWALNTVNQWRLEMAQGVNPARSLDIVCGHGDSPAHPTQLHVFIQDYEVNFIEYPGGNKSKSRGFTGQGLPKTGDVSTWDLEVSPQTVDGGRYQILITVQGVGFIYRWLLVDGGQGYFRGVNPK